MERTKVWTVAIFLFVLGDAMALQARGPILSSLEATFAVSEAELGLVAPAGTAGFAIAAVATGLLAGRLRMRWALFAGVTGVICALVAMAAAPVYAVFLLALLAQGGAAGVFRGVDRAALSHIHSANRGRVYIAYALAWAVGAVLGPQLVTGVLAFADWRAVFLVLAGLFVPVAVVAARTELPSMEAERSISVDALRELLGRPPVVGATVGILFTGAVEGIVFTWLVYYAEGFYGTGTASLLLSTYLLAYIPARTGYTLLVDRVPYLLLMLVATVPAIPAFAVAFSGITGPVLFVAVFVAGAGLSSCFPALSAYAVEAAPEYSGPINALTTGATYVGIAVSPAVVGVLTEAYGLNRAIWLVIGFAVLLSSTIAATWLWTGTPEAPTVDVAA